MECLTSLFVSRLPTKYGRQWLGRVYCRVSVLPSTVLVLKRKRPALCIVYEVAVRFLKRNTKRELGYRIVRLDLTPITRLFKEGKQNKLLLSLLIILLFYSGNLQDALLLRAYITLRKLQIGNNLLSYSVVLRLKNLQMHSAETFFEDKTSRNSLLGFLV